MEYALERSDNTHVLKGMNMQPKELSHVRGISQVGNMKNSFLNHKEHNQIRFDKKNLIKVTLSEFNFIANSYQKAFD